MKSENLEGVRKKKEIVEGYKFWLALFNSKLFWFFIQNTGDVRRGAPRGVWSQAQGHRGARQGRQRAGRCAEEPRASPGFH